MRSVYVGIRFAFVVGLCSAAASGQVWTGLGGNGNWDYSTGSPSNLYSNWSLNTLPGSASTVAFGNGFSSGDPNLNGNRTVAKLDVTAQAAFTLQSSVHTLTIASGSVSRASTAQGVHTIDCNVQIGANGTWSIDGPEAAGHLRINGVVTDGAGAFSVSKLNAGTLILGNANTYDGGTVVGQGKLLVANTLGSGTGTGPVTINNGAIFGGTGSVSGNVTVQNGATVAPGSLAVTAAPLAFNGGLRLDNGAKLALDLGATSDQILVTSGTYRHTGSVQISVSNAGGLAPGQTYVIVSFAGATPDSINASDFTLGATSIAGSFAVVNTTVEFRTLAAPTGLTATPVDGTQISLNWSDNPEPAATYDLYRGLGPGFFPEPSKLVVSGLASSQYVDSGLNDQTTYYYRVIARDAFGNSSALSNEASATTQPVPEILYVKTGTVGGDDGASWTTAFDSLQSALAAAGESDQIWIAAGTWLPGAARSSAFVLKNDVKIYGGFRGNAGDENSFAHRDLATYETILSGEISGQNCYHVVRGFGLTSGVAVDGVTIAHGVADGSPADSTNRGGGLLLQNSTARFVNCTFRDNAALLGSAAVNDGGTAGTATFVNCVFSGNTAVALYGTLLTGGLGTTVLSSCTIAGNTAPEAAVLYNNGTTRFINSILWNNVQTNGGGSIITNSSANTTITYSCVEGGYPGTGNISVDPKFIDAPGGDLRLQSISNCVESGSTVDLPPDDGDSDGDGNVVEAVPTGRDGASRVAGTAVDMGAFEVASPDPPPSAPTDLTAALLSATQVVLDWNDSPEPDHVGYNLYRSTTAMFEPSPATLVATGLADSTYMEDVVDDGTTYYYTVTATDTAGGESLPSTVPLTTRPGAPTGLSATGTGLTQIEVDWDDSPEPDVVSYDLHRSIIPGFTPGPENLIAGALVASAYTDSAGLVEGRTYYYVVSAVDAAGNRSAFTAEVGGTTLNEPGIIYVHAAAAEGGDGTSWAAAMSDLRTALTAAGDGDEVWVAAGIYRPTTTTDRRVYFVLKNNVGLYGGFPGLPGQEGDFSVRDYVANETILSGNIKDPDNQFDNTYHVVIGHNTDRTAVLDGFSVVEGRAGGAPNPNFENLGAGINIDVGSPTIRNCVIHSNGALVGAGTCVRNGGSPLFENCIFRNNVANLGGDAGGGAYVESGSTPTFLNCAFLANSAGTGGGAFVGTNTTGTRFINCLFSGNSAEGGGAVANRSLGGNTRPAYINCVFALNTASVGGSAILNQYTGAAPTVVNSILWGNSGSPIANYNSSAGGTVTYSCIEGGHPGTGNISSDPLFVDADGPDDIAGTTDDDLRVQPGSPVVDVGDSAAVPAEVLTDDALTPRILGQGVDMGAYETIPPIRFDYDSDGDIDGVDFAVFGGCGSGPAVPRAASPDCDASDADSDGDVDLTDFAEFQRCQAGPDRAPPNSCM